MSNKATAVQEAPPAAAQESPAAVATAGANPAGAQPAGGEPTTGAASAPNESAPEPNVSGEAAPVAAGASNESTAAAATPAVASAAAGQPADTSTASTPAVALGVEARLADLPQAEAATVAAPGGQVDILLDTMMPVAASLGQVTMPIRQLLQLGQGSVVKLDREVGAPIDLFLRGIQFATGHLVVVGEHLGVRIHEIRPVNPALPPPGAC